MTLEEFIDLLESSLWVCEEDVPLTNTETFKDRGLLTNNDGLVVTMENGDEFQLTVVKSK